MPTELIRRFFRCDYSDGDTTYDIIWWDAMKGKIVLRYDGADPANTDERYGATPDEMIFTRKGLDIKQKIHPSKAVFTYEMARKELGYE